MLSPSDKELKLVGIGRQGHDETRKRLIHMFRSWYEQKRECRLRRSP